MVLNTWPAARGGVLVALVTSFMAPLGLRLTLPRVRMTDDEAKRMVAQFRATHDVWAGDPASGA